jgi:hypothetical protein
MSAATYFHDERTLDVFKKMVGEAIVTTVGHGRDSVAGFFTDWICCPIPTSSYQGRGIKISLRCDGDDLMYQG